MLPCNGALLSSDSDVEVIDGAQPQVPTPDLEPSPATVEPGIWDIPDPYAEIDLDRLLQRIIESEEMSDPAPPGMHLLQSRAGLIPAKSVAARVHDFDNNNVVVNVSEYATFSDVRDALKQQIPVGDRHSILPVYPPCTDVMDCILVPPDIDGTPAAVQVPGSGHVWPCLIAGSDTAADILHRLKLPTGALFLAHKPWSLPSDGLFPGMTLTFAAATDRLCRVATPCRTRSTGPIVPGKATPKPVVLSLSTALPSVEYAPIASAEAAINTHACLDTLLAALHSFQPHSLRRDIPSSVTAHAWLLSIWTHLNQMRPLIAFMFTWMGHTVRLHSKLVGLLLSCQNDKESCTGPASGLVTLRCFPCLPCKIHFPQVHIRQS